MYDTEWTRRYWRRCGSAGFVMRNRPCLHNKIDNYTETWYFLIILLVYNRVGICVKDCKLLYQKTKRKGFIFHLSHGIPPKWTKKNLCVLYVRMLYRGFDFKCNLTTTSGHPRKEQREISAVGRPAALFPFLGTHSTFKGVPKKGNKAITLAVAEISRCSFRGSMIRSVRCW